MIIKPKSHIVYSTRKPFNEHRILSMYIEPFSIEYLSVPSSIIHISSSPYTYCHRLIKIVLTYDPDDVEFMHILSNSCDLKLV